MNEKLTPQRVEEIFNYCEGGIYWVDGINGTQGFNEVRLQEKKADIIEMLNELPLPFHEGSGSGWSFLNMCHDKDGNQWTGLHMIMSQLVYLGVGIGRIEFCMPRNMWGMFPGGMPYFVIKKG